MKSAKAKKPYYYSGGKRVTLEPAADLVALNEARLAETFPGLPAAGLTGRSVTLAGGDIRLVPVSTFASDTLARLKSAGVTQTVFRQDGATLVVFPEIRVEDDAEAKLAKIRKFAESKHIQIVDEAEGRLTLKLDPANPGEAISLAAQLVEDYKVASATPRFLRLVPRLIPVAGKCKNGKPLRTSAQRRKFS